MSGILDLLNSDTGKGLIDGIEQKLGINKASVAKALGAALPMILGGMRNNTSSSSGASGLLGALLGGNHNGSILDEIGNVFGGGSATGVDPNVMTDGGKILGHIFGEQKQNAAHVVSKSSGIDLSKAMDIMKVAAPFVMGYIGKQMNSTGVSDQSGLKGLLGGFLGDDLDKSRDVAARVQGFDNNDDTLDDIAGMVSKYGKEAGGIANLLSGLFS